MKHVIFIPIKEESQRVPHKNFRKLSNVCLWKRAIEKFSQSKNIHVYIDTDSDKIIDECKNIQNVTAYKREDSLIGHNVSVNDLIYNFIQKWYENKQVLICQVHVTSPFLDFSTIKQSFNILNNTIYDSVVGCNKHQCRFWRKEDYGFCPVNHNPMKLEETQALPVIYEENSSLYAFSSSTFMSLKKRVGVNPYFMEVTFPQNVDIDTEDDWEYVTKLETIV